jgi:hypothetical protein
MLGDRSQDTPSDKSGIIGWLKDGLHKIKSIVPGQSQPKQ